jgi:hypothetical protein
LKEKKKKLKEQHESDMKSILTEEQYQKYLQLREEKKKKHHEKGMKNSPEGMEK